MSTGPKDSVDSLQKLGRLLGKEQQMRGNVHKGGALSTNEHRPAQARAVRAPSSSQPVAGNMKAEQELRDLGARRQAIKELEASLADQKKRFSRESGQLKLERNQLQMIKAGIARRRKELSGLRQSIREEGRLVSQHRQEIRDAIESLQAATRCPDPLQNLKRALVDLEQIREELKSQLEECARCQAEVDRRSGSLKPREEKIARAEERHKKQIKVNRELRAKVREHESEKRELNRQIQSFKRKNTKLAREIDSRDAALETAEVVKQGVAWLLEHAASDDDSVLRPEVVVAGSGPISCEEMSTFLQRRGINVFEPDSEGVPFMIVGRDDWSEYEFEMQIAAQEGSHLQVYSQELALIALAAGADPFDSADKATLEAFANGHPALEFLRTSELCWPLTASPSMPAEFTPFAQEERGVDASPLKKMGYTVGKTSGVADRQRHRLLERAFIGELPHTHSDEYMEDWGAPHTRRRLWRMSHHLAWLARSWKKMPSHRHAVEDWANDLAYLKREYYRPWMRFSWPSVRVPGKRGSQ